MIVTVIGMHRSGTSMIARLLNLCGVDLGPEVDLVPATPDNPDGHWEHRGMQEVNEEVLSRFGGGWDHPPNFPANWVRDPSLDHARTKARRLIEAFQTQPVWGWKDPRTSLTLPFWADLLPEMKVLVCVRNPLAVALSLHRRRLCSYVFGLELWKTYNGLIQATTRRDNRLVTHYAAYFPDAAAEVKRIAAWLGLQPSAEVLDMCRNAVKPDLCHHQLTRQRLQDTGVAAEIVDLYQGWCDEAGYDDGDPIAPAPVRPALTTTFDLSALEADSLRIDLKNLRYALAQRDAAFADSRRQLDQSQEDHARARRTIAERDAAVAQLQRQVESLQEEAAALRQERDAFGLAFDELQRRDGTIEAETHELRQRLAIMQDELDAERQKSAALESLVRDHSIKPESAWGAVPSAHRLAYQQTVLRLRELVREHVPDNSVVAIVSKGDDELLQLDDGRRGWHFPQDEKGGYAGYYPATGRGAVVHLEVMRARGACYLTLPSPYAWWLESYPEFKQHLEGRYRELARGDEAGILWSLAAPFPEPAQAPAQTFEQLVERFRGAHGREPAVLDWNSGRRFSALYPDLPVFAPPSSNGCLPYVDRSVDVVAIASPDPHILAEARRVAETAVVNFQAGANGDAAANICWLRELAVKSLPSASIVIPVYNQWKQTDACLSSLRETLPAEFHGEIIVVDDGSSDETRERLAELAGADKRLRVFHHETNRGFLDSCQSGAAAATGEFLIFLNNDTVLLSGWLSPLLRTFEQFPDAGAVGGKLLFADGRVQEAGGIVFADASAAHFGRGDPDPATLLFNYVREVDYCSGALLATRRALFEELGGFDETYRPGYYEDTDYCFRLREKGWRVYYQPEAEIVHLEGATSGHDPSRGMKQYQAVNLERFRERWSETLREHPTRPLQFDDDAWYALARRGRERAPT